MGLFGKPAEPPAITTPCTCGATQFVGGGTALTPMTDGRRAWVEPSGAVLACLACGRTWYTTPQGLKEPHAAALPTQWASRDLQKQLAEAQARAAAATKEPRERDPDRPARRHAGPHEGFVLPPKT